jgi:hypothetical protein
VNILLANREPAVELLKGIAAEKARGFTDDLKNAFRPIIEDCGQ